MPSPEDEAAAVVTARDAAALRGLLRSAAEPIVGAHHCELLTVEFRRETLGWVLRLVVERLGHDPREPHGGVTLDQCAKISRDYGTAIEVAELIDHAYHLEVSSPGLERPLVRSDDFQRFAGLRAKVQLHAPTAAHPGRRVFRGEILDVPHDPSTPSTPIMIRLHDDDVGEVSLPHEQVARAHLLFETGPTPRPGKPHQVSRAAGPQARQARRS